MISTSKIYFALLINTQITGSVVESRVQSVVQSALYCPPYEGHHSGCTSGLCMHTANMSLANGMVIPKAATIKSILQNVQGQLWPQISTQQNHINTMLERELHLTGDCYASWADSVSFFSSISVSESTSTERLGLDSFRVQPQITLWGKGGEQRTIMTF